MNRLTVDATENIIVDGKKTGYIAIGFRSSPRHLTTIVKGEGYHKPVGDIAVQQWNTVGSNIWIGDKNDLNLDLLCQVTGYKPDPILSTKRSHNHFVSAKFVTAAESVKSALSSCYKKYGSMPSINIRPCGHAIVCVSGEAGDVMALIGEMAALGNTSLFELQCE